MSMQATDVKEQEQDWISKYRAALDERAEKEPYSHGLGAFLDLMGSRFKLAFRHAGGKSRASGRNKVAILATQAAIGNRPTEQRGFREQVVSVDLECGKAS
jgi:hypothetical protein